MFLIDTFKKFSIEELKGLPYGDIQILNKIAFDRKFREAKEAEALEKAREAERRNIPEGAIPPEVPK